MAVKIIVSDLDGTLMAPDHLTVAEATKTAPGVFWTGGGVHPSVAGAKLMSAAWLNAVNGK